MKKCEQQHPIIGFDYKEYRGIKEFCCLEEAQRYTDQVNQHRNKKISKNETKTNEMDSNK